jgi:hypothetical protein
MWKLLLLKTAPHAMLRGAMAVTGRQDGSIETHPHLS